MASPAANSEKTKRTGVAGKALGRQLVNPPGTSPSVRIRREHVGQIRNLRLNPVQTGSKNENRAERASLRPHICPPDGREEPNPVRRYQMRIRVRGTLSTSAMAT